MSGSITFKNCRICLNGSLVEGEPLVFSEDTGLILESTTGLEGCKVVDLNDKIVAPGFLELQTNGVNGFHFTHFDNEETYIEKLKGTARYYVTKGVTSFWVTIPTVSESNYKKVRFRFIVCLVCFCVCFVFSGL